MVAALAVMPVENPETLVVRSNSRGEHVMSDHLQQLIDAARHRPFSEDEREAQRRSFAYGNTKIENDLITREMIDEADERIKAEIKDR
jgi:hypothetical protein